MSESEAKNLIKEIIKKHTINFDLVVYERENIDAVTHKAKFAIKMDSDEITDELIKDLKYQKYRLDRDIEFVGSKVDVGNNLKVAYLFIDVEVKLNF